MTILKHQLADIRLTLVARLTALSGAKASDFPGNARDFRTMMLLPHRWAVVIADLTPHTEIPSRNRCFVAPANGVL